MNRIQQFVIGALLSMLAAFAHAALPTEATAAFTSLSDNLTAIFALVWPILATAVGGWTLMKLFKKGAGKAV